MEDISDRFSKESWCKSWDTNVTGWHSPLIHARLKDFWDEFCPEDAQRKLVFAPLCGKSVDLAWMYSEKACEVVGCDVSETALKSFVSEQQYLDMQQSMVEFNDGRQVALFHTPEKRLRLYLCDLFDMDKSPEPPYNFIWDRGSLVAMNPALRTAYVNYISKLAAPDVRWLLETFDYPEGAHSGPPCRIDDDEYEALFGTHFNSHLLVKENAQKPTLPNAAYCHARMTLLTRKKTSN